MGLTNKQRSERITAEANIKGASKLSIIKLKPKFYRSYNNNADICNSPYYNICNTYTGWVGYGY